MRKLRIVQLGPAPPPYGGVATNMLAIHNKLRSLGHQSTIVDVTNRKGDNHNDGVIKPGSAVSLARILLSTKFDIVHYHIGGNFSLKLAFLTLFCGLLPRKRSIVTFHSGGWASENEESARPTSIRGVALRSVDAVIAVNRQISRMFRAHGVDPARIRIILPFELCRPDPAVQVPPHLEAFAERSDPLLLSVGALEPEYRNDFLIDAMPAVLDQFPNAGLMVVGSGSLANELEKKVESSGLTERAMFTGNLDHSVALHLIERADTLLRITDFDGDSIAVREAEFLGTPVIASDNGERPASVLLLPKPFRAGDLVERLIEAGRAQVSGHSTAAEEAGNAEKVVKAYTEILAG